MSEVVEYKRKVLIIGEWERYSAPYSLYIAYADMARFLSRDFDVTLLWFSSSNGLGTNFKTNSLVENDLILFELSTNHSNFRFINQFRKSTAISAAIKVLKGVWGKPDFTIAFGEIVKKLNFHQKYFKDSKLIPVIDDNCKNIGIPVTSIFSRTSSLINPNILFSKRKIKKYSNHEYNICFPTNTSLFYNENTNGDYIFVIIQEYEIEVVDQFFKLINSDLDTKYKVIITSVSENRFRSQNKGFLDLKNVEVYFQPTEIINLVNESNRIIYVGKYCQSKNYIFHLLTSKKPILFLSDNNFEDFSSYNDNIIIESDWKSNNQIISDFLQMSFNIDEDIEEMIDAEYSSDTIGFQLRNIVLQSIANE